MRVIDLRRKSWWMVQMYPNVGLSKTSKMVFSSSIILSPCMTFFPERDKEFHNSQGSVKINSLIFSYWLVVWNIFFLIIYGMSSFPLTFIFFKMVETTNQHIKHLSRREILNTSRLFRCLFSLDQQQVMTHHWRWSFCDPWGSCAFSRMWSATTPWRGRGVMVMAWWWVEGEFTWFYRNMGI